MIPENSSQYEGNISFIETQQLKRKPSPDPPYIRMLTSSWEIASNAIEDINAIPELSSLSETSSGIDMKGESSITGSSSTLRSEDTNTSTLANISLDEDDSLQNLASVMDDERSLSVHSISSVSVRK